MTMFLEFKSSGFGGYHLNLQIEISTDFILKQQIESNVYCTKSMKTASNEIRLASNQVETLYNLFNNIDFKSAWDLESLFIVHDAVTCLFGVKSDDGSVEKAIRVSNGFQSRYKYIPIDFKKRYRKEKILRALIKYQLISRERVTLILPEGFDPYQSTKASIAFGIFLEYLNGLLPIKLDPYFDVSTYA